MVGPVPFIHFIQLGFTVMNGKNRTLGQNLKLAVRDQGGDLDNDVVLGIEAGHFKSIQIMGGCSAMGSSFRGKRPQRQTTV